ILQSELDNTARVKKAYRTLFGREPLPEELKAGVDYLSAEPLRSYEERKTADDKKKDAKDAKDGKDTKTTKDGKDAKETMGEGMMPGVMSPSGSGSTEDEKKKMLPVPALGRYLKILLSCNECLFVD